MVNDEYKTKVDKLKEDLIYAMNEKYEGEFEIEDVTDSAYSKMALSQDKKIIDNSSHFYSEVASKLIESLEEYLDNLEDFNRRTIYRNSEVVEDTLKDLYKATEIFILSIRKNNADWQARLYECRKKEEKNGLSNIEKDSLEYKLFDVFSDMEDIFNFNKGDDEDEEN